MEKRFLIKTSQEDILRFSPHVDYSILHQATLYVLLPLEVS